MDFAHLRIHSHFSLDDGLLSPEVIAKLAAKKGQSAAAITDLGRMFGGIQAYQKMRKEGVKPIIGLDAWIESDITNPGGEPTRILLLSQDLAGYRTLMDHLSRGYRENQSGGHPLIRQSWLQERNEGMIALSGDALSGETGQLIVEGKHAEARKVAEFYRSAFGDRFYLEIQRYAQDNETAFVQGTAELAAATGIPLVATHPIQFAERTDYFTHEVRTAIASKKLVEDINRKTIFTREQYFKDSDEMAELFADIPEALENARAIARRINLEIPLNTNSLPDFPTEDGSPLVDFFTRQSREGLEERLRVLYPDSGERDAKRPAYIERLEYEIGSIVKMGFPGYFMIVADAIQWCKKNGIAIGPGRGSGAGSLVAYALKITDLDPLEFNLLFERFLNPDRVSMPDFDIDIDPGRREELFEYMRGRYGADKVAQIAAMGTLAAKASIKDVGRALGYNYNLVNTISKLVPKKPVDIKLDQALKDEPRLMEKYQRDPQIKRLLDIALSIEGKPRNVSIHAGGLVIAPTRIGDFSPAYVDQERGTVITQYDKKDVETAGLVKFDFLALANLTVMQDALKRVQERTGKNIDINLVSRDDRKVYEMLAKGDTMGVFQLESGGMKGWARAMKMDNFNDIIALVALYRPGPMDMIPSYVRRKHGTEPVHYPDPRVEKVLSETYGIMVYQEQVMQMAQLVGGYTLGGADILRKAMGKKLPEEMAKHREIFVAGAVKGGIDGQKAGAIYDDIEKFAGYGFNKSHAAAYAFIAYQTAWLKAHYPSEYYSAMLDAAAAKQEKISDLIRDAAAHDLEVARPDINSSTASFRPVGDRVISYGLASLKGVSDGAMDYVVRMREEKGAYESFYDFCKKALGGGSKVNKTVVQALIRAGAFDALEPNRAMLMQAVEKGSEYAKKVYKRAVDAQAEVTLIPELFGALPPPKKAPRKKKALEDINEPAMMPTEPWSQLQQLQEEAMSMGFYFSGHPYEAYSSRLEGLKAAKPLSEINEIALLDDRASEVHLVAGVVTTLRAITNRNGDPMAFVGLSDGAGDHEITLFSDQWESAQSWLKVGDFAAFEANIKQDPKSEDGANRMTAENAWSFDALQQMLANQIHVVVRKEQMEEFKSFLNENQGPTPVTLYHPEGQNGYLKSDTPLRIAGLAKEPSVIRALGQLLGPRAVHIGYQKAIKFEPKFGKKKPGRR
jgi:DNA polymerase-3 subunit alpha